MTKHNLQSTQQTSRARELRHDSTFPEQMLWSQIRAGRLAGLKFRRQYPFGAYVADFFCHEARLVIELDGASHDGTAQRDQARTEYLHRNGFRVLRVGNDDVIRDMESVLNGILKACGVDLETGLKRGAPHPSPLPEGEGDSPP